MAPKITLYRLIDIATQAAWLGIGAMILMGVRL